MSDSEIDELLRRYRPAAPPAILRNRLTALGPGRRTWPWAGAAAALLLVTGCLQMSTQRIYRLVGDSVEPEAYSSLDQLPALSDALGGDEWLRSALEEKMRQEREQVTTAPVSDIDSGGSWQ